MSGIDVTYIDHKLLERVSAEAKASMRLRMNHNFHQPPDKVQRFLNAIEPDSYIRPHRHINPLKDEVFLLLRGKGMVIIFTDNGDIATVYPLDIDAGQWGVDIPGGIYHTIFALEPGTVFYEIKPGPFDPKAPKSFGPWAPAEETSEALNYLRRLVSLATHQAASLSVNQPKIG